MDSNWANLPKHLLDMVLEKLNIFSDYARFSVICKPWFSVAMENRNIFSKKINRQVPMLLFPKRDEEKGELKSLYDVTTKKLMNLEVRVPFNTRYGGSSKGWLIIVGEDCVVNLINPISLKAVIKLPPILGIQSVYPIHICKAILSTDPATEPNDYTVVAIYGDLGQLAFIKPGGQEARWTYIDKISTTFDDIIYYKGRLHAVNCSSKAFSFDDITLKVSSVPRELSSSLDHLAGKNYLVESLKGDLLLVYRHFDFLPVYDDDDDVDAPHYRITLDFKVFKWNPNGPNWAEIKSLGGESIFLGDNMTTSILASEIPGCSPNSIYFTHDFDNVILLGDSGPIDAGVFNLEDSSFSPHYEMDEESCLAMSEQPPIWFLPNFLHTGFSSTPTDPMVVNVQNELQQLKFIPRSLNDDDGRPYYNWSVPLMMEE